MIDNLLQSRIAIVGAGNSCKMFLRFILDADFIRSKPQILGVADLNPEAVGMNMAREMGIFTTTDYTELYRLEGLETILELTDDPTLRKEIMISKPSRITLIDHFQARSQWDLLKVDEVKTQVFEELQQKKEDPEAVDQLFNRVTDGLTAILEARNQRSAEIELELVEHRQTLSQIIQGSTIPTFVIDRNHLITHWNIAMEKLTGVASSEAVGTDRQWWPFYKSRRPSMADVILDRISAREIEKLYGKKWRRSALIEGAYEAENYFEHLNDGGKWCWFTAAPIKSPDGTIVGAIETVWDKTEDKKAEQQREEHTRLLTETARALSKSERTMTQIIQGSTMPTFVIDENHTVTHWNRALERLTGHRAGDIVGTDKQWTPFYGRQRPTMADVILDQIEEKELKKLYGKKWRRSALINGAYEAEGFFRQMGRNGRWFWFTAAPIKAPDGAIVGAIETLWDKTEDKRAEQERELHTTELTTLCSIYSALNTSLDLEIGIKRAIEEVKDHLKADGVCIYLKGNDGKYHFRYGHGISKEYCRQFNEMDETSIIYQVAQKNEFAIFEDLPQGSSDEIYFLEEQQLNSLAYIPISSKEKKTFGVIRIGSRKPDQFSQDHKKVLELIGNRIGVAIENARLQEQYIKSEEKYRSLFNNDPNPIFILDRSTFEILDTNQRAQDGYGYRREELLGKPFLELGDAGDEELAQGLANLSEDQSVLFTKKRHYRKNGRPFYVNVNISPAKYGESDVVIASTTDISESIEKETQLVQASKMTTLGTMAAGMAHEINQPLNVIQVCADFFLKMLKKGVRIPDQELSTLANDISENVQRAAGIIKHMRDFARQSDVVTTKIDINNPIKDVFKVLGHQLKVHQIDLRLDLDPDIPPILAEHNRLEQVFINMVTNAIDAMDEKGQELGDQKWDRILEIKTFAENGEVVAKVSDSGTGMSQEVMDKIFEPFFTTKEVGRGTGLGVAISYGIVKDYDGTIEVTSRVGEGTTFELRFPVFTQRKSNENTEAIAD